MMCQLYVTLLCRKYLTSGGKVCYISLMKDKKGTTVQVQHLHKKKKKETSYSSTYKYNMSKTGQVQHLLHNRCEYLSKIRTSITTSTRNNMTSTTDWTTDRTSTTYKRVSRYILDNQYEHFTPQKLHKALRLKPELLSSVIHYMTEHHTLTRWGRGALLTKTEHADELTTWLERGFNQHTESGYHPKRHTGILTADIKSPLDTPSAVDKRYISGYDSNGYVKPEAHYNKELGTWVVPSP